MTMAGPIGPNAPGVMPAREAHLPTAVVALRAAHRVARPVPAARPPRVSGARGMHRGRTTATAGAITTQARGETDLATPTRDGVREPLNRRTAITISFR